MTTCYIMLSTCDRLQDTAKNQEETEGLRRWMERPSNKPWDRDEPREPVPSPDVPPTTVFKKSYISKDTVMQNISNFMIRRCLRN